MDPELLKQFLDEKVDQYNQPFFIARDPVSVPHGFRKKQDIEIAAFFAAIFSWGNRTTILQKSKELMALMDNAPWEFCLHSTDDSIKKLVEFKHRTFKATDLLYFIEFIKYHYVENKSLESAFTRSMKPSDQTVEQALNGFCDYFFSLAHVPQRTRKHIASPQKNSTCKRLNMFLRWMVRSDDRGVDFGIWKKIKPAQLICPVDLHVSRVARKLGLISRSQTDWQTALELTGHLRGLDPADPVKYDFALFGLGIEEHY
jgi:uncharacterized protein (TIGR02757 family)